MFTLNSKQVEELITATAKRNAECYEKVLIYRKNQEEKEKKICNSYKENFFKKSIDAIELTEFKKMEKK